MKWLMTAALVAMVSVAGCGSDTGGAGGSGGGAAAGCNTDPWKCTAGQTCWVSKQGTAFACLNSGAGKIGDACQNIIDQPQCADGMTCLQIQGQGMGVCSPFCDPSNVAHACPSSAQCVNAQFGSAGTVKVCQVEGAGGAGGGGSSSSTGSSTSVTSATGSTGSTSSTGAGGAGGK